MKEEDLRPGRSSDAPALTAIARAAKRHWGYPEPWLEAWSSALTITPAFLGESFVLVAERDTGPVGFVGLIDQGDHWLLEHLWVLPEHQRRGLGRRLFDAAMDHVRAHRPGAVRIEADPFAQGFYERCGARKVGTVPAPVLGTPRELPLLEIVVEGTSLPNS